MIAGAAARVPSIRRASVSAAESGMIDAKPTVDSGLMIDFGMEQQEFRSQYFEKNCLLLRGALKVNDFAWKDVDELLYRIDPLPPHLKVFKGGAVAPQEFVDESLEFGVPRARLNKSKFYDQLRAGATVVMNRIETLSPAALRLCHTVGRFAGHPAIGNAYLSFGGRGSFGKHWDTHDVFVVQLLGKKRWRIFKPTWPLPLSHQTSGGQEHRCPETPEMECELSPGDVLYLPRGWWHDVIPCEGGSFHLSVGTYAPTAMEFLQWVCQRRLAFVESLRVGLTGDAQRIDADGIVAQLKTFLSDPHELAAFHRAQSERQQVRSEFDLQSLAETPGTELPDDTIVSLNSSYPAMFNGSNIVINGSELRLESLRRALVLNMDKSNGMTLRALYACVPAVPRSVVRAALHDLAQHDVVNVRRPEDRRG